MTAITSTNPATEELNATIDLMSREELDRRIALAHTTFLDWRQVSHSEKRRLMMSLADLIESEIPRLARIETQEMGMLYHISQAGLQKTVGLIRWFAEHFSVVLQGESYETQGMQIESQYDPLGVIYGIAPWNFPFNQLLRAAVPNLLAGNTVIYKHASNTPLAGIEIESLFLRAGFAEGVYQNLLISSRESEYILSRDEIRGVNLTGSEGAGRAIGALAGKYLKPSVLELGGNDAFIVADTSDLSRVALEAVRARISNNGQRCNSSKRFIVRDQDYDQFCTYFTEYTEALVIGDPMEESTQIGPMARADLVDEIDTQVQKTVSEGARLLTGGKRIEGTGYFYAPTVLADVTPEMTSYREEVFGPVASIIRVRDLDEAVEMANHSDFGLSGCVYGDDLEQCLDIARRIEGGMIFINRGAASQASLPFGGVKKSGYGKENGPEGLRAFTNKKVIVKG